jgi:hypothetical protein
VVFSLNFAARIPAEAEGGSRYSAVPFPLA